MFARPLGTLTGTKQRDVPTNGVRGCAQKGSKHTFHLTIRLLVPNFFRSDSNLNEICECIEAGLVIGSFMQPSFVNPRGLHEICGIALAGTEGLMDLEIDALPIRRIYLIDLVGEHEGRVWNVAVCPFPKVTFSILVEEALGLGMLMKKCQATRAFEFGTHRGVSSTQLAANLPEQGQLFTLDLPRSNTHTHFTVENAAEKEVANYPVKGDLIPEELRKKVTLSGAGFEQLFDPTPYAESMDFIFVDAAHTIEYVVNDSEKAWAMLKPGGIVAWHDCRAQSPDVVKYLRSCKYRPLRIHGTTLAFAEKPKK